MRNKRLVWKIVPLAITLILFIGIEFPLQAIERRKEQFPTDLAWLITPLPFNLPGIGSGLGVIGLVANVFDTTTDVFVFAVGGDIEGNGFGIQQLSLIPEHVFVDYFRQNLNVISINVYGGRGFNSDPDDFQAIELNESIQQQAQISFSFFERRFTIFGAGFMSQQKIVRVRDPEGEILAEFDSPETESDDGVFGGVILDFTDDFDDGRVGLRIEADYFPPDGESDLQFAVQTVNTKLFIPIGISTLVFNYYTSDTIVSKQGETDRDILAQELGINCDLIPDTAERTACETSKEKLIDNTVASNKYGTAGSLGGQNRLRSYPGGRFTGAHLLHYGVEFRWNLTDESTPFNLIFIKDLRTAIQVAFFHEVGSVADDKSKLGTETRSSSGVGLRLVTGSGVVYRLDIANGDEGTETTLIFNYPWG